MGCEGYIAVEAVVAAVFALSGGMEAFSRIPSPAPAAAASVVVVVIIDPFFSSSPSTGTVFPPASYTADDGEAHAFFPPEGTHKREGEEEEGNEEGALGVCCAHT